MMIDIKVPLLPPDARSLICLRWFKTVGSRVRKGDALAEIQVDQSALTIVSPATGILTNILIEKNTPIVAQQILGTLTADQLDAQVKEEKTPLDIVKLYQTLLEEREGHKRFAEVPPGKPIDLLIAEQARLRAEGGNLSAQGMGAGNSGFKDHPLLQTPYFDGIDPKVTPDSALPTKENEQAAREYQLRLEKQLHIEHKHQQQLKAGMKPST